MTDDVIQINLQRHEALIFFEWLAALEEKRDSIVIGDAEHKIIWQIEGQLESILVEVVSPDYDKALAEAKRQILGKSGSPTSLDGGSE